MKNGKIAPFLLQRRHRIYIIRKIHASYKMYFDDNMSNVGIGLDVLINMPCIGDFRVSHEFVLRCIPKYIILWSLLKSDFNKIPLLWHCRDIILEYAIFMLFICIVYHWYIVIYTHLDFCDYRNLITPKHPSEENYWKNSIEQHFFTLRNETYPSRIDYLCISN